MNRPKVQHSLDSVRAGDGVPDRVEDLVCRRFADKQALGLPIDDQADRHEQDADGDRGERVPYALPGHRREGDADQGDADADQRSRDPRGRRR